jgi:hypothetical protein
MYYEMYNIYRNYNVFKNIESKKKSILVYKNVKNVNLIEYAKESMKKSIKNIESRNNLYNNLNHTKIITDSKSKYDVKNILTLGLGLGITSFSIYLVYFFYKGH